MEHGPRARQRAAPVSLALTKPEKATFEAEARRRGLGLSTTIRALAVERANEIREQRQLERAERWQIERIRELASRIEDHGFQEATQDEIDSVFGGAEASDRRSTASG
jgi:hypothetical protein